MGGELEKYGKKSGEKEGEEDLGIEAYLIANQMAKCLNPKCGLAIAK